MKRIFLISVASIAVLFISIAVCSNKGIAQIKTRSNFENQFGKIVADRQLKFPNLTRKFYAQRQNQLLWLEGNQNLVWKAHGLLYDAGQYGLKPCDFKCDQITPGLLNELLTIKGENNYKTVVDILITDALINFINQLHYGMANPAFPLKKLDSNSAKGWKATEVLAKAVAGNNFEQEILKVQPSFEGYRHLQQYLRLLVGQYTGDCYESPPETEKLITVNLERWRWFNSAETPYLLVNIPAFELQYDNGVKKEIFRVIVGKPATPTPVLESSIKTIAISPEWKVPENVLMKEILPNAIKNPSYFRSKHFFIYDSNGKVKPATLKNLKLVQQDVSKYTVIQKPGKHNTLGRLVLYIENQKKIRIRDTPDKSLFTKENRALGTGSVMMENPEAFVELLMIQEGLSAQIPSVQSAMMDYKKKVVTLAKPIPLFIGYFTCDLKDGILNNYPDIYHFDEPLRKKMKLK